MTTPPPQPREEIVVTEALDALVTEAYMRINDGASMSATLRTLAARARAEGDRAGAVRGREAGLVEAAGLCASRGDDISGSYVERDSLIADVMHIACRDDARAIYALVHFAPPVTVPARAGATTCCRSAVPCDGTEPQCCGLCNCDTRRAGPTP